MNGPFCTFRRPLRLAIALGLLICAGCATTGGTGSLFTPFAAAASGGPELGNACPVGQVVVCRTSGLTRAVNRQAPEVCGCGDAPSAWNDPVPTRNSTP